MIRALMAAGAGAAISFDLGNDPPKTLTFLAVEDPDSQFPVGVGFNLRDSAI
jgi:hypothetical protein